MMPAFTARGKRILVPPAQRHRFEVPVRYAHPAVRQIWLTLNARDDLTLKGVAKRSGVDQRTIRNWRRGASPKLADIEAVLNAMNLTLRVGYMLTKNKDAVS
jgi:hypothetical protein